MDHSWWSTALAALTAAGTAVYLLREAKQVPQITESAKEEHPTLSLTEELEKEHGDIIANSIDWKEMETSFAEQNCSSMQFFNITVFFREEERDKIYDKLQRKGFNGSEIKFFSDKSFLILSLRVCEVHRLEKLRARYRILGPANEPPVCL